MTEPQPGLVISKAEETKILGLLASSSLAGNSFVWDYRRKTDVTLTVGFIMKGAEGTTRGYLKCYANAPARAAQVFAKRQALTPEANRSTVGFQLLSDQSTLCYLMPNDHGLRFLKTATTLDKLKRAIREAGLFGGLRIRSRKSKITILRYKPEKRLIAQLQLGLIDEKTKRKDARDIFMRVFPDRRGEYVSQLTEHLRNSGLSDHLAKQHGTVCDGRIQLEEQRPGSPLSTLSNWPPAKIVAELLVRLGQVKEAPCAVVSAQDMVRSRLKELESIDDPETCLLIRLIETAAFERLGVFHREDIGVIHGDLHPDQFLWDGQKLTLVDLERSCLSHPAIDLGHFLAELQLLESTDADFVADYSKTVEQTWAASFSRRVHDALPVGRALGLIAAAARAQRRNTFEFGSPIELLNQALSALQSIQPVAQSSNNWICIYPSGKRPWAAYGEDLASGKCGPGLIDPISRMFSFLAPEDDTKLPGLSPALKTATMQTWRPGRRAVVRFVTENGEIFRKVLPPKKAIKVAPVYFAFEQTAHEAGINMPSLLRFDSENGFLDLSPVAGDSLHSKLMGENEVSADIVECGRLIRKLHALTPFPELPNCRPDNMSDWLARTASFFPEHKKQLTRIFDRLPPKTESPLGVIHGDLHDKNVLVSKSSAGLIDVDGVALGPLARDVGNFLAHLELRGVQSKKGELVVAQWRQAFLEGYVAGNVNLTAEAICAEELHSSFRLICLYLFRRKWQKAAHELMSRLMSLVFVLVAIGSTAGCVALNPEPTEDQLNADLQDAKTRLGVAYLKKKDTIEIEGSFDREWFRANRIEIEEDDDETEIKSTLVNVDLVQKVIRVGAVEIRVTEDSKYFDRSGASIEFEQLANFVGEFCKAEAIQRSGDLNLRKLVFRTRKDGELDELQGQIESLKDNRNQLYIGSTPVSFRRDTPVFWDVSGVEAPAPHERGLRPRSVPRLKNILRIDDDDLRQGPGIKLADNLILGGEVQWDLEWRRNHNLRNGRPRDRLIQEPSIKLEFSYDVSPDFFVFAKLSARRDWAIFDERIDDQHGSRLSLSEGYFVALDFPFDGVAFELGRQKFDHGREWVMDDEIDGARIFINLEDVLLEFSVSQRLFDESPEKDGVTNYMIAAHLNPFEESELLIYAIRRSGGRLVDLDRYHMGFSYEQNVGPFTLWADVGYVVGREDKIDVEGFGFDLMLMYEFDESDWSPTLYAGLAWGSGDDDISDGKDSSFRQTGLNDNNDRFGGVTSFRYLGELFRPEVSNIQILTFGFGVQPFKNTSFDFLFHNYRQVAASDRIRDTRIRLNPGGLHESLGSEVDIVIGLQDWRPVEIEIVLGYFRPGQAFEVFQDDAWFVTFQVEWNF